MPTLNPSPRLELAVASVRTRAASAVKYGTSAGMLGQARSQDPGQAHERGIDVEIRQRRPLRDDLVDARARCQQSSQRLLACHDHAPAACLHHGCIADELDRIPQAMVGVQEDRIARPGASHPRGAGERPESKTPCT